MNISLKYHIPAREIDFLNVNLTKDNKLFIDPLKIRKGKGELHKRCYNRIEAFVNMMIKLAKDRKYTKLLEFVNNFYERNETKLGYSLETTHGKSFGENGGIDLVKVLVKDDIVESGFVEDIFDFLMMVPNIAEDKVSDIITTIIFLDLIEYTQEQCEIWKIPTEEVKLNKMCWDADSEIWRTIKTELPVHSNRPIVFIPKSFVTKNYIFSHKKLYRDVIIPPYKDLELRKDESKFVIKYKNGGVHVLGNKLREEYPCTKYVILDFVKKYDLVYRQYKSEILSK